VQSRGLECNSVSSHAFPRPIDLSTNLQRVGRAVRAWYLAPSLQEDFDDRRAVWTQEEGPAGLSGDIIVGDRSYVYVVTRTMYAKCRSKLVCLGNICMSIELMLGVASLETSNECTGLGPGGLGPTLSSK